ncbi:MAG TPA: putative baseplate assembly protein [Vicinamibacterales bacterium]|nr:putative baseplate assembly protein [Vicinamibacterales bacterium]
MLTPARENNVPGLSAIAYRAGTWATFKESMLARLSNAEYPALATLKTRDDDDFSIALLDASSVMLDILTFYQERLANESYLRTATQLRSLTELSRLIGYQPAPGVGSSVYLSFSLQAAPGAPPDPSATTISIPAGTQVQSVPAQDQTPQTFETSADILAKADWNALQVQTGAPWIPAAKDLSVYLDGTATQLQPGDAILIVGDERTNDKTDPHWDLRIVTAVEADTTAKRTYVTWSAELVTPSTKNPVFYALRQKAALFGYNAVNPLLLAEATQTKLGTGTGGLGLVKNHEWVFGTAGGTGLAGKKLVDLDAVYSKLTVGGWLASIVPNGSEDASPSGSIALHLIKSVTSISRSDYGNSAKITRLLVDRRKGLRKAYRATRSTSVLTQSEALAAAEQPLDHPLYGSVIDLKGVRVDLAGIEAVAVYGKSQKLKVKTGVTTLSFTPDDETADDLTLKPGDVVTILEPVNLPLDSDGAIPGWTDSSDARDLRVLDAGGRSGTLSAALDDFTLVPASSSDPGVQEFALVSSLSLETDPYPHTRLHLASELLNCYDRTATTVNANVGLATQGMSVSEILGNGSAITPNQKFSAKQTPLTFVQSPTETGRLTTLEVTVNGVAWTEAATLYQQARSARVFTTLNQAGGGTDILFGDGVNGAMLPTGQNNIRANYRIGSGLAGNVSAGSITTLMDRPLGVSGVNNPQAATGGQDAQSVDDIRSNAPLSVLTLGRAVSITDYVNFAQSFAGIAKAHAIWIPSGPGRGVFVTVAAAGGSALPAGNPTLDNLATALQNYGNPLIPIHVQSFLETLFSVSANIKYDPAYDAATVQQDVVDSLREQYGFGARTFGQGVSADEIDAVIQGVAGVIAVNVTALTPGATSAAGDLASTRWSTYAYNQWLSQQVTTLERPASSSSTRICAYVPVATPGELPFAAEILVLDPDPNTLVLGALA